MEGKALSFSLDKQTLIEHLETLRKVLIICTGAILIAATGCFYISEQIMDLLMKPLSGLGETLIVTGVTEAFFVKIKVSLIAGIIVSLPVIIGSLWSFIKPALYPHERKIFYWLLPLSVTLFLGGMAFSYYVVLKMVLNFFIIMAGQNLDTLFKVDQYVGFILAFVLPFGIVFEMPVVVYFLSRFGLITHSAMIKNRRYAILVIAILSALLTPGGDPISMLAMAIPLYVLFEISILVAKITGKKYNQIVLQGVQGGE